MIRRSILALALAAALSAFTVGATLAHECVISNRSAAGDAGATNSKVWGELPLAVVLGFIHEEIGEEPLTEAQIEWAVANRGDLPIAWVTRMDKTIGAGSANPNLADGHGLDHLAQLAGPQVAELFFAAQGH